MTENVFLEMSEVKSVTVAILSFTFLTAVAVSSATAANTVVFTPAIVATSAITCTLIKDRSAVLVKSNLVSVALAVGSVTFATFAAITLTTD